MGSSALGVRFDIKEWILLGTLAFSHRWHKEVEHLSFPTAHLMTIILFMLVQEFPSLGTATESLFFSSRNIMAWLIFPRDV